MAVQGGLGFGRKNNRETSEWETPSVFQRSCRDNSFLFQKKKPLVCEKVDKCLVQRAPGGLKMTDNVPRWRKQNLGTIVVDVILRQNVTNGDGTQWTAAAV